MLVKGSSLIFRNLSRWKFKNQRNNSTLKSWEISRAATERLIRQSSSCPMVVANRPWAIIRTDRSGIRSLLRMESRSASSASARYDQTFFFFIEPKIIYYAHNQDGSINCEKKRCLRSACQNQKSAVKKPVSDDDCCQCRSRRHPNNVGQRRRHKQQQEKHQQNFSKSWIE